MAGPCSGDESDLAPFCRLATPAPFFSFGRSAPPPVLLPAPAAYGVAVGPPSALWLPGTLHGCAALTDGEAEVATGW
jgi:hypothetical protein